jgi:hypothetical protein
VSSMPIQVYALTWSADDTKAITAWQEQLAEQFLIAGWSRILFEPLHVAVADPNIFSMAIDGIVIRDHKIASHDGLKETLKKLNAGMLKLYSTANGAEPVVQTQTTY